MQAIKLAVFSLVISIITSQTTLAAPKFPSFNLSSDMLTLLDTAFFHSDTDRAVKISGKKYTLKISAELLLPLIENGFEATFKNLLEHQGNKKKLKPFLFLFADGFKDKYQKFHLKLLVNPLLKFNLIDDETFISSLESELEKVSQHLTELKASNPKLYKDLTNLTDLENKGLVKKKSVSADGKTQTYTLTLGDSTGTFVVTKI